MMLLKLGIKSLSNRKGSVFLTLIAMTVSVFVLLAVEHIRYQAKENFANSVSGVDLIVGAKTGSLNLLLYSVFHIGSPTNNISWSSVEQISNHQQVKWAVPISLGDSHKGYRVMGTTEDYFEHFSYGKQHKLAFDRGSKFEHLFDLVLGYDVANELGYSLGDKIVLAHGLANTSFSMHDDKPFTVVGILEPTGTPVDQTLHVSLEGIEAIHINWRQGVKLPGNKMSSKEIAKLQLKPKYVTALMLGLKSRMATFGLQRKINEFDQEPLLAILPGVALSELWQMMGLIENTLLLIAILVLFAALLGLTAMLLSSIRERTAEIRLLRVIGAPPVFVFLLIQSEALFITITSMILGAGILSVIIAVGQDLFISRFGLYISTDIITIHSLYFAVGIALFSIVLAIIPALTAYRQAKK